MKAHTLLWISEYGDASGRAVVGVLSSDSGNTVMLMTENINFTWR